MRVVTIAVIKTQTEYSCKSLNRTRSESSGATSSIGRPICIRKKDNQRAITNCPMAHAAQKITIKNLSVQSQKLLTSDCLTNELASRIKPMIKPL